MEPNQTYDDEITLKELILKVQEYWRELWRHWLLIGLITVPFLAFKVYKAVTTKPVFPATLTFMVDEDEGNRMGSMVSLLGQFGLGGPRGQYNLNKILEISRSRRVLQLALFSKSEVKGKNDFLANHLINQTNLHERWEDDTTGLKGFYFQRGDVDGFGKLENKVLKTLQGILNGSEKKEGLYNTSYDEDTGIMKLKMESWSEDLAINMVDTIFSKLTTYYVKSATEKSLGTYAVLKSKTDSLALALSSAEYRFAEFLDKNQNVYSARQGLLQQTRLSSEVQRLQIMHGEAIKNLEFADFSLKSETPFITLIDNPIAPLRPVTESLLMAIILGSILGGMIGVTYVLGRKIYRDTMNA